MFPNATIRPATAMEMAAQQGYPANGVSSQSPLAASMGEIGMAVEACRNALDRLTQKLVPVTAPSEPRPTGPAPQSPAIGRSDLANSLANMVAQLRDLQSRIVDLSDRIEV